MGTITTGYSSGLVARLPPTLSSHIVVRANAADRTRTFRPASLNTIYPVAKVMALTDGLVRPVIIAAQMGALVQEEL